MSFMFTVVRPDADDFDEDLTNSEEIETVIKRCNEVDNSRIFIASELLAVSPITIGSEIWSELIIKYHYSYKIKFPNGNILRLIDRAMGSKDVSQANYIELARKISPNGSYELYDYFGSLVNCESEIVSSGGQSSETEINIADDVVGPFIVFKSTGGPWPGISSFFDACSFANEVGSRVVDARGVTVFLKSS